MKTIYVLFVILILILTSVVGMCIDKYVPVSGKGICGFFLGIVFTIGFMGIVLVSPFKEK